MSRVEVEPRMAAALMKRLDALEDRIEEPRAHP